MLLLTAVFAAAWAQDDAVTFGPGIPLHRDEAYNQILAAPVESVIHVHLQRLDELAPVETRARGAAHEDDSLGDPAPDFSSPDEVARCARFMSSLARIRSTPTRVWGLPPDLADELHWAHLQIERQVARELARVRSQAARELSDAVVRLYRENAERLLAATAVASPDADSDATTAVLQDLEAQVARIRARQEEQLAAAERTIWQQASVSLQEVRGRIWMRLQQRSSPPPSWQGDYATAFLAEELTAFAAPGWVRSASPASAARPDERMPANEVWSERVRDRETVWQQVQVPPGSRAAYLQRQMEPLLEGASGQH